MRGEHSRYLTKRQTEVMNLLAKGYQYKEIARELHVSIHTIKGHMKEIHDRLRVDSAAHAVIAWKEQQKQS